MVINSRGRGAVDNKERGAVQKQVVFFILKEMSSIYDTVSLKWKRREHLEACGSFSGDNLFYACSTLPPKSNVCLKSAIYYVNTLDQLIWLVDALGLRSSSQIIKDMVQMAGALRGFL